MKSSSQGFDAKFFAGNRAALKKKMSPSVAVLSANGLLQKSLDAPFPFRQDSNFWYLTGLDVPSLVLVLDESDEYIILPKISDYMQTFDGGIDKKSLQKVSGIKNIYTHDIGWKRLSKKLKKISQVGVLAAAEPYVRELDMYTNPSRAFLIDQLLAVDARLPQVDVRSTINELRLVKKPQEIDAIRKATELTMRAFGSMSDALATATNEDELERIATVAFAKHSQQHAYSPIVASGKNATTLHYVANNSLLGENELVLIDIGASNGMYSSDITRTISKNPSPRQLEVHKAVNDVLSRAKELIKPGVIIKDLEEKVRRLIASKLVALRLIDSSDSDEVRHFYPHSASHFVGLDVHDPTPRDVALAPNMVLTIEPGIYIEKEGIGVRIEDIVVVTDKSCDVLSGPLSRGIDSLTISPNNG